VPSLEALNWYAPSNTRLGHHGTTPFESYTCSRGFVRVQEVEEVDIATEAPNCTPAATNWVKDWRRNVVNTAFLMLSHSLD
jgi:hypothetical protein